MQRAISQRPDLLQSNDLAPVRWVSPLEHDDFAEYRDGGFLDALGLGHLSSSLHNFWPRLGPQWDALGTTGKGVVLVEAKAHIGEFRSPPSQAGATSLAKITAAFKMTQMALGVSTTSDWTGSFYQYANRLAHLLFVSFINDVDMRGPSSATEWHDAFREANDVLGLSADHRLALRVHHVFPDVRLLVAS